MAKYNLKDEKRTELRESLWPGSGKLIWDRKKAVGFTTVPRLLPLVLHLIKVLAGGSKSGDPSAAYIELWCRDFGQGLITIFDEEKSAFAAGYSSNRALRTWREHILKLSELGFIRTRPEGLRENGQILLLDPIAVCERLRAEGRVPEALWTAFVARATEIGAVLSGSHFTQESTASQPADLVAASAR